MGVPPLLVTSVQSLWMAPNGTLEKRKPRVSSLSIQLACCLIKTNWRAANFGGLWPGRPVTTSFTPTQIMADLQIDLCCSKQTVSKYILTLCRKKWVQLYLGFFFKWILRTLEVWDEHLDLFNVCAHWKCVGRRTRRALLFMPILQIRASSIARCFIWKLQHDHHQCSFYCPFSFFFIYAHNLLQIRAKMQHSREHLKNLQ